MPSLAPPSSSLFSSIVSQASRIEASRERLLSNGPVILEVEDGDDTETLDLHSLSSSTSHSNFCESCAQLEVDFAGAVLFVDSYQGPHRVLTQKNSSPRKDLYAYYQQASVGPCSTMAPPVGLSKPELSKWEKWRELGNMTRQEAMKRYTTVLDNLVDNWRCSANVRNLRDQNNNSLGASDALIDQQRSEASSATLSHVRRSTSMFERLPRIYDELGELQERIEDEAKKRDELEDHLLHSTRENRIKFKELLERMEQIRNSFVLRIKNLEDDVVQHKTELQQFISFQEKLAVRTENSVLLAIEARARQVFWIVQGWARNRTLRASLVVLVGLRVWHHLRHRRLLQILAQILIRWLVKIDSSNTSQLADSR